jgi:lipopolysaccharide export LptBFGC system permease protein LptF
MTIVHRYMAKRLCVASIIAVVGLCGPVTLVSTYNHLSSAAIYSELVWPALYGIAPMILYHTMPVAVAVAITWCYANFYSEFTFAIMQSAGISGLAIRTPAVLVALLATAIGYVFSCFVAPNGARHIQNVLNVIEHAPNPSLLEPGQFYSLDGDRHLIYFHKRLSRNNVAEVFLRERTDSGQEFAFSAREAVFDRREDESWIVLLDGEMQVYNPHDDEVKTFAFKRTVQRTGLSGSTLPKRNWVLEFELGPLEFLRARVDEQTDPAAARRWEGEAVERFATPALALMHTVLGLGLLTVWGDPTGRRPHLAPLIYCIIFPIHLSFVIAAEHVAQYGSNLGWGIAAAMLGELAVGVLLMVRRRRQPGDPFLRNVPLQALKRTHSH